MNVTRLIDYVRCSMATLMVYLCKRAKPLLTFGCFHPLLPCVTLRKPHECPCNEHGAAVLFPFIHRFKRTPDLCRERWRLKRHANVSRPFVTENGNLVGFPVVCVQRSSFVPLGAFSATFHLLLQSLEYFFNTL